MITLAQCIFSGILTGLLYSLIGLGLTIVWRSGRIVNLAQGEIIVLGGFVVWSLVAIFSPFWWLGLIISFVLLALVGLLIERFTFRPIIGQPIFSLFMMSIALILVFRGILMVGWGGEPQSFPVFFPIKATKLGPFIFDSSLFWGGIISFFAVVALTLFFERTKWGLKLSAVAEDHQIAQSLGISVKRAIMIAWVITALFACFASIVFLNGKTLTHLATVIGFRGVVVAILAGLESIMGIMLAGVIVGISEALARAYLDPLTGGGMADIVPFVIMIVIILIKPQGLFGWKVIERV